MEKEELVKVYVSTRKVVVNEIKAVLSDTKAELCDFFPTGSGFIIGVCFAGSYVEIVYTAETELDREAFFINVESIKAELTLKDKNRQFFCEFGAFMANEKAIGNLKILMRTWHCFYKALHEMI